jgi:preprotein translocase subunit SecA
MRSSLRCRKLTDDQLRAKTDEFRARIQERMNSIAVAPEPPDAEAPEIDYDQKEIDSRARPGPGAGAR